MSWLARFAMRLYPKWWRRRYATELQALVEDSGPTWWTVLDVGKQGLAMQIHDYRSPLYLVLGCALLGAGVGAGVSAAVFATTPPRWALSIEVQSRSESPETRLRALASQALSDDNLERLAERLSLYRADQDGQAPIDLVRRFRDDVSLTLTPVGFDVSFSHPEGAKGRQVVENLTSLIIDANLRAAQAGAAGSGERYRVAGPPRQDRDGPDVTTLTAFGLGAGMLAGLALTAVWRRRMHPR